MIYIKTTEGKIINYVEVLDEHIPNSIFYNVVHANTCEIIADNIGNMTDNKRRVFVNLLFTRSKVAKFLTAIQFLQKNNFLHIEEVVLPKKLAVSFQNTIKFNIAISPEPLSCLIDFPSKRKFIAKYFLHKLYRLYGLIFNPKNIINNSIVRTFVEVTETLHKNRLKESLCLFFPFSLKIRRQRIFLHECKSSGYQVGFWGVPYSFKDLLKILFNRNEENIVNFEHNGHFKQGKEFVKLNLQNYYTEDDYDASAFLIASTLIENGCNVVNAAHGVGQFGPYINCSVFEALNRPQIRYYSCFEHNHNIRFTMQNLSYNKLTLKDNLPLAFVLVHAPFKERGVIFSANLQTRIVEMLSGFTKDNKILIKYHPNGKMFENTDIEKINTWDEISEQYSPVFLTLNSTSFFTNFGRGPFIFLGDKTFNPFDIIDDEVEFYHYRELGKVIANYSDMNFYKQSFQKQVKLLADIQSSTK